MQRVGLDSSRINMLSITPGREGFWFLMALGDETQSLVHAEQGLSRCDALQTFLVSSQEKARI